MMEATLYFNSRNSNRRLDLETKLAKSTCFLEQTHLLCSNGVGVGSPIQLNQIKSNQIKTTLFFYLKEWTFTNSFWTLDSKTKTIFEFKRLIQIQYQTTTSLDAIQCSILSPFNNEKEADKTELTMIQGCDDISRSNRILNNNSIAKQLRDLERWKQTKQTP